MPAVATDLMPIAAAVAALRQAPGARRPLADAEGEALGLLYARYAGALLVVARRIVGERADAEDVVHDVFCRLPWIIAQYGTGGLGGWLKQVTARTALMRLRSARTRREETGVEAWDEAAQAYEDTADLARREDEDRARRAVAQLPEPLRQAVELRVYAGYSHQEVAEALGITANASQVRCCRAIKALRAHLLDRGPGSAAGHARVRPAPGPRRRTADAPRDREASAA